MLIKIFIAIAIIFITTIIHAVGMVIILDSLKKYYGHWKDSFKSHIMWVGGSILFLFFITLLEVLVWALTFITFNAIDHFEQALYFSMVTYTTLGYGDVLLDEHWRLLGSFAAANGIIMFGWTTAIVIAVVQKVYHGTINNK
ncbi:MAG: potassium channel family protein [Gammaproteobacteria bacterium]|nr:potassium channel family protein [Gammaproteobacteria bacterium]